MGQQEIDEQMLNHYEHVADGAEAIGHKRTEEAARWVLDLYGELEDLKGVIDQKDKEIEDLQWQIEQQDRETYLGRGGF